MTHEVNDELLDLVDANDQVIGTIWRSQAYSQKCLHIRAASGFLRNSAGQLWVPRRVKEKKSLPCALDMSFSGAVASGETYQQTFEREVAEELRLDVNTVPWRLLGKLTPYTDATMPCFAHVYEISYETTPDYNPDDYSEGFWLSPHEIMQKLAHGEPSKAGLPLIIKRFYSDPLRGSISS